MVAPIGSPPVMRLIMIGRAMSPEPAMAPSTHLFPVLLKALANSATAAASPPEVHQCVTSRSTPPPLPVSVLALVALVALALGALGAPVSPPFSFLHPAAA